MTRSTSALLVVIALLVASCSVAEELSTTTTEPTTTTSTSTTSTTLPPTTTTTLPLSLEGAPAELTAVVEAFYDYTGGRSTTAPPMPEPVLSSITPQERPRPAGGTAATGAFKGQTVATAKVGEDLFLAVDDGSGWRIVGGSWPSASVPTYYGGSPRLVAVVGSDARPGQTVERSRADSIHFVGLDGAGDGGIVGLPRDAYVPVPGFGRRKITGSLALGGPDTMMAALEQLSGLPLEGYVLTGFAGFQAMFGSVLGGATVDVPFPMNDRWAKVVLSAGSQILNGAQALGFARARKTMPRGDFTRSEHQGVLLLAAARVVKERGPLALPGLLEASDPHLQTSLTPEQLLTFSTMVIASDIDSISNIVAPGSVGTAGGASVVFLASRVSDIWSDLSDGRLDG